MKKNLVAVVVILLLLAGGAAAWFFRHASAPRASRLAECLPGDTVVFIQLPDLRCTRERWPKTALAQIAAEPEVQAFLERPRSRLPKSVEEQAARIARIDPGEAFLAVTAVSNQAAPKVVAGFSFNGKNEEAASLLADARGVAQRAWPAGKSDIVKAGNDEIETFTFQNNTLATVVRKNWAFIGNDLELLKSTLARMDGKTVAGSLKENASFSKSLAQMPRDFDAFTFVQMHALIEPLASLITLTSPTAGAGELEKLRKIDAFAGATKLDGENIRDAIFTLKPGEAKEAALQRTSLVLTSPETLGYHASRLDKFAQMQVPVLPAGTLGMLGGWQNILTSFTTAGLSMNDFIGAFGPEAGFVADWPTQSQVPSLLLALDVRDAEKARKFMDALAQSSGSGGAWIPQTVDGSSFLHMPQTVFGMVPLDLTVAQTDKFLLASLSMESVKAAAARAKSGGDNLSKSPAFTKAGGMVHDPAGAFSYVDTRTAFERLYGLLRPYVMMGAALATPRAGDYLDISKLPAPETIGKHLQPIVYSQSSVEDGVLAESVGPVTYSQAAGFFLMGAGAAAVESKVGAFGMGGNAAAPSASPSPPAATPSSWSGTGMKAQPAPSGSP